MDNLQLYVHVVLKHILDLGQKSPIDLDDEDEDKDLYAEKGEDEKRISTRRQQAFSGSKVSNLDLLDLDGPKLIIGARTWILFYQITGQLNWLGKPLYLSLLYKVFVVTIIAVNLINRFIVKMYDLNIVNENYRNPIFLFISFLTLITLVIQGFASFRANLLEMGPFFNIFNTPRLCFVREEVQHIVGTRWLKFMLIFFVYHSLVMCMLVSKDLNHFINEFRLVYFLVDLFTITALIISMTGMSLLDLYVRTCFGHWLLALKNHIESRFTYLHKHQRRLIKIQAQFMQSSSAYTNSNGRKINPSNQTVNSVDALSISDTITTLNTAYNRPLLTFDEIQKHLNKMDDHLEAARSVQISSLVLLSLNAFLLNGALFLLSYHLLADQHNFYHGFLVLLMAINCIFVAFLCYSGDRWLFYALSSFTQTVEDEYFMQSDIRPVAPSNSLLTSQQRQTGCHQSTNHLTGRYATFESQLDMDFQSNANAQWTNHSMLLIKKKDVLFCHEFLHQFENHLATPWSNLTVKTHLHMLRTFVTLIAAQIIFDHEH